MNSYDIAVRVGEFLDGLYSDTVVSETSRLAQHYIDKKASNLRYQPVPSSLHGITSLREMSDPIVEGPETPFRTAMFHLLGVYDGKTIYGPLNHILARMITIPMMLKDYIEILYSTVFMRWLKVEYEMIKDGPISTSHCL